MQAYKVKGKIDETGHLIVSEPIELHPGEVEVILLQSSTGKVTANLPADEEKISAAERVIPGLKQWLEKAPPVSPDYDPEQAKWDYLKEKHNL